MYFIAQDGYIHGFVRISDPASDYNGGTWITICPSYTATIGTTGVPLAAQVPARSDLVASPDATQLLYIGVDGYIYGFNIINIWDYQYISFIKDEMEDNEYAVSSLIFGGPNDIFYVGNYFSSGNYVFGFHISDWHLGTCYENDPAYAADIAHGQSWDAQAQAEGALLYDPNNYRIFYKTIFGLLAYYQTTPYFNDFMYYPCPGNFNLYELQLVVQGNIALHFDPVARTSTFYFVARSLYDGTYYIYYLQENSIGSWGDRSPSVLAEATGTSFSTQVQADPSGQISVSPDGTKIAYLGNESTGIPTVAYFNFDGIHYYYYTMAYEYVKDDYLREDYPNYFISLQFVGNTDLYFIDWNPFVKVLHFKWQEDYCNNPYVYNYENGL